MSKHAIQSTPLAGTPAAKAPTPAQRLRLLVAIASFGEKNLPFLKQIIANYRKLEMAVDIVVLSNAPKDLGPDVEIKVGLPSKNPWSLPFAHKSVLADNLEKYDLFIYTEDDMAVSAGNLQAFLRVTPLLAPDEIAGYLRYEIGPNGVWSLPDVHGSYHWKPDSVRLGNGILTAEFTNEHAGFFVLTQSQLRRAIASGGFLQVPYEGEYGMLETAATDPYTRCGFRRVVCISELDNFLIHHLPNKYVAQLGIPLTAVREQVETLKAISLGTQPASTLCATDSALVRGRWGKSYYEKPRKELLGAVPVSAGSVLSVGCGWGATEAKLMERGAKVTALPLDSVIGAAAARLGIEVINGTLEEALTKIKARKFDCMLVPHMLHLVPKPEGMLARLCELIEPKGTLILSGPNFGSLAVMSRRLLGRGDYRKLRSFAEGGITPCGPEKLSKTLKRAGLRTISVNWVNMPAGQGRKSRLRDGLGKWSAKEWILVARR